MPTPDQLRDEYIIETKIDDQASAAAGNVADALNRMETAAGTSTKAVAGVSDATGLLAAEAEAAAAGLSAWNGTAAQGARAADGLSATLSAAAQAAAAVGASTSASQLKVVEASRQFAQMATRVDDISRAAGALETILRRADAAHQAFANDLAKGVADVAQGERVFDAFGASVSNAAQKLATLSAQRGLSPDATAGLAASLSPNAASAFTAAQSDQAAKSAATLATELNNLRASIDPVFASSKRYETQLDAISDAQKRLGLSAQQVEVLQDAATKSFAAANQPLQALKSGVNDGADSSKRMQFAMRDLGTQSIDLFQGLATGQPIFRTLIQQGAQVVQVNQAAGISMKSFGAAILGALVSPTGLIIGSIAAATAAIVGFGYAAESAASRQAKLRDELSATRSDYLAVADAVKQASRNIAASTPASSTDAATAAQTLASSPRVDASTQSLTNLGIVAQGLSQVLGKSIQDTATLIADAASDPAKVAVGLASAGKLLTDLDAVTLTSIIHMQQMGDTSGATAKIMAVFGAAAQRAKDDQTPLTKALQDLSAQFNATSGSGKSFAQNLGEVFTGIGVYIVDFVKKAVKQFQDLREEIAKLRSSTQTPQSTDGSGQLFGGRLANRLDQAFGVGTGTDSMAPAGSVQSSNQIAVFNEASAKLSAAAADFTMKYVQYESGFNQTDPKTGGTLRNPGSSASGLFQLTDATASDLHVNSGEASGNIAGGVSLIGKYWTKYQGDAAKVALAMAWGMTATDEFLAGVRTLEQVPQSKIAEVKALTGVDVSSINRQIQTVTVSAQGPGGASTAADATNARAGALAAQSYDQQAAKLGELNKQLVDFTATRNAAAKAEDAADDPTAFATAAQQVDHYNKLIAQTAVDINAIIHPTEAATKATQDQGRVAQLVYDADRKQAEVLLSIARQREQNPLNPISDADAAAQISAELSVLSGTYKAQVDLVKISTAEQNKLAAAWSGGAAAAAEVVIQEKAHTAAVNAFGSASPLAAAAAADYAAKLKENAKALNDVKLAQDTYNNSLQIQYVQAEISSLGQDDQARQVMLAHLQAENSLRQQGIDVTSKQAQEYLNSVDTLSALNQAYQQQQSALQGLANMFSQSFDTIGNAMAQAFVQGQGQAVNWGNVMKSVVQQVIQQFAKLSILNPILNSLFGQNNATLGSTLGALGALGGGSSSGTAVGAAALAAKANGDIAWDLPGSSGGTSGGGGILGSLSNLGSVASAGNSLGLGEALGLTGPNGLLSNIGLGGSNGIFSGVTGLLGTQLIAPTGFSAAALSGTGATSLGGLGADAGSFGSLAPDLGGLTLGGALTGIGGGFALGSLAGGFIQSSLGKVGPAPTIGAGVGALAGAGIGTLIVPGIGTIVGGLLGGLLGGSGGGLIGPKPASPFSSTQVSTANGALQQGSTVSQLTDTSGEVNQLKSQLADVSAFLNQSGLTEQQSRTIQIGQNSPKGPVDNSKFSDLYTPNESGHSAFSEIQFSAQNPNVNAVVSSRSYPDLQTLQTVFNATSQFVQSVANVSGFDIGKFLSGLQGVASSDLATKFGAVTDFLTNLVPALAPLNLSTNVDLNGVSNLVSQFSSLSDAFSSLRFTSGNGNVNQVVSGRGFSDQQSLTTVVTALNQFVTDVAGSDFNVSQYLAGLGGVANSDLPTVLASVDQFVTATVPTLLKFNTVTGSLNDAITQINTQFATAIQTAHALGYQEQALTDARDAAVTAAQNATRHSADLQAATTTAQYRTVQAGLTGGSLSPDAESATLATFDVQRQQQIEQLRTQYQGIFGDGYATTVEYVQNSVALENSLGAQRLAVQKQYSDAIEQADLQLGDQLRGNYGQFLTAKAQVTGSPADAVGAQLYNFDAQAQQQREQLVAQFKALYGDLYAQTVQYGESSAGLEQSLGEQRLAIQQQYNDQIAAAQQQVVNQQNTYQGQYLTAAAQVSGSPDDAKAAALYNFDAQAQQQRQQLVTQFKAIYGDAYAQTAQYAQTSVLLEKSLGEQRLAVQKQYDDQIKQQASQAAQQGAQVIQGLNQYALSLQTSSDSPLSPTGQLSIAKGQFDTVSGKAAQGDYASIQQLQTTSQAYLAAARNVYGSGTGYVDAFSKVIDALGAVANQSPDVLTASILKQTSQTQTDALVTQLQSLNDEVHQLRLSVVYGSPSIPIPSTLSATFTTPTPANDIAPAGPIMMLRPGTPAAIQANAPAVAAADINDALAQVVTLLTAILQTLALNGQVEGDSLDQLKAAAGGIAKLNTTVQQAATRPPRAA